ncbi:hypothetical protein J4G33_13470 [Actinotalea sp. BY-33]|uniref:Uncharacterized protein n=1 Tax=Actinotalea soli TaxID=2819234 RepID=A0A939LQF6_9CELL|nr:hypothetical protein [Actinotalea soli]MBO1752817.1 hypothetical protein [Actinotalea soli]
MSDLPPEDTTPEPSASSSPPTAQLETLTDEELAVLSVADTVPVTPHLSEIPPRERRPLIQTAYRGLVARGIITPPTAQARARARAAVEEAQERPGADAAADPVGVEVEIREDVASTVALREGARVVVAAARTAATQQDYLYVHLVEDVALVELVTVDGYHHFSLRHAEDLLDTVLEAVLHPEAAGATGEPVVLPPLEAADPTPPLEILERAGEALLRCDLTVLSAEDPHPTMLGLFTSPTGSWLFEARHGTGDAIHARPVSTAALREAVETLLRTAGGIAAERGPLPGGPR